MKMEKNSVNNNFNSHPHEEDDDVVQQTQEPQEDFNSHPHEEDDGVG